MYQKIAKTCQLTSYWGYLFLLLSSSCAYRFTNGLNHPSLGVRSIYVESIYDTTKGVWPHHVLWQAIQHEIAVDSNFSLKSKKDSGVYIRLHIEYADIKAKEVVVRPEDLNEREILRQQPFEEQKLPSQYGNLNVARQFTRSQSLFLKVRGQFFNTLSQKMIHDRVYTAQADYRVFHPKTPANLHFLWSEEALMAAYHQASEEISSLLLQDLYRIQIN